MKKLKTSNRDQGVAIILALIFLAIFMILAFAFTARAVSAGRSANYQSAELRAQAMCESALQSAIYKLKSNFDAAGVTAYPDANSTSWTAATFTPGKTLPSKHFSSIDGTSYGSAPSQAEFGIDYQGVSNFAPATQMPNWYGLTTNSIGGTATKNIMYSWYIIPFSGCIDPNYTYKEDFHTGTYRTVARTGLTKSTDLSAADPVVYQHEIYDTALTPSTRGFWKSINDVGSTFNTDTAWVAYLPHNDVVSLPKKDITNLLDLSTISNTTNVQTGIIDKIPYLKNAVGGDIAKAAQIALNIKDYIDQDNVPSTITIGTQTLYGIEAVPLINELDIKFTNKSGPGNKNLSIDIAVSAELLAMYPCNQAEALTMIISGNVNITPSSNSAQTINFTQTLTWNLAANSKGYKLSAEATASNYTVAIPNTATLTSNLSGLGQVTFNTIHIDSLVLKRGTTIIDTVNACDFTPTAGIISRNTSTVFNMSAYDPRINDVKADWSSSSAWTSSATPTIESLNAQNKDNAGASLFVQGTTSSDYEPGVTDISKITSTEKFRNAKPTYLCELGTISRGIKFQTLNLCDYREDAPTIFDSTKYANTNTSLSQISNGGDRSLLDYVYTDPEDPDVKKSVTIHNAINPNSQQKNTLSSLFYDVKVDADDLTSISDSKITDLINGFPGIKSPVSATEYFPVGSRMLNTNRNPKAYGIPFRSSSVTTLDDRDREQLLWKTKNLISTDTTYFMFISTVTSGYDITTPTSTQRSSLLKMTAIIKRSWNSATLKFDYSVINRSWKGE